MKERQSYRERLNQSPAAALVVAGASLAGSVFLVYLAALIFKGTPLAESGYFLLWHYNLRIVAALLLAAAPMAGLVSLPAYRSLTIQAWWVGARGWLRAAAILIVCLWLDEMLAGYLPRAHVRWMAVWDGAWNAFVRHGWWVCIVIVAVVLGWYFIRPAMRAWRKKEP